MEKWLNVLLQSILPVLKTIAHERLKEQLKAVALEQTDRVSNLSDLVDRQEATETSLSPAQGQYPIQEVLTPIEGERRPGIQDLLPTVEAFQQPMNLELQRQQFQQEKAQQQQLVNYHRETLLKIANHQRETTLQLAEVNQIFNNWPLRLSPSQILDAHPKKGKQPLRIFLAPPTVEYDTSSDRGADFPDIELKLAQGLREFLGRHYPLHSQHRPTEFLGGAWASKQFHGESSIKALFGMLKSEPTLVLESEIDGDRLHFRIAYWGLGQQTYCYETIFTVSCQEFVRASARDRARKLRQTRDRLLSLGKSEDDFKRLAGENAQNLALLEEEEELQQAGIDINNLSFPYRIDRQDWDCLHQFLITCHCLVAGGVADVHHLVHDDISPQLPKLLPRLTQNLLDQQSVQAVMETTASIYQQVFKALTLERPHWIPELTLKLAHSLTDLPDSQWAEWQLDNSLQRWLQQRQVSPAEGRLEALRMMASVLTVEDEPYCQKLQTCLKALGDQQGVREVQRLLETIASLKTKKTLVNASPIRTFSGFSEKTAALAFCPDGETLVSSGDDNTLKLWQWQKTSQPTPKLTLYGDSGKILTFAVGRDGQTLVSSTQGKDRSYLQIWNAKTGKLQQTLFGHKKPIHALAINPNGKYLASGSHKIKLWNLETGEALYTLFGHKKGVYTLAYSPDRQTIISGSDDCTVKIWTLDPEAMPRVLSGHRDSVRSVAVAPDGKTIASGSDDCTIKLWNAEQGKLRYTLTGHTGSVYTLALSNDGQYLISGSKDKTIKIWHLERGELLQTLTGHESAVCAIAIAKDGQTLASGSEDRTVKIWQAPSQ